MTAKRILLGVILAGVVGTSAAVAQTVPTNPAPLSTGSGLLPSSPALGASGTGNQPSGGTLPLLGGPTEASAVNMLTAPPGTVLGTTQNLPKGSVPSPWAGASPVGANCCGPVGANGPVTYELYTRTGPVLVVGGGPEFSGATRFGWAVEGGGRSLFMNPAGDSAWVVDLGIMYAYNGASEDRVFDTFIRAPLFSNPANPGDPRNGTAQTPDQIHPVRLRGLTRTGLNYSIGRDWWLNGPGVLPNEQGWNSRVGLDVGGRWGTMRADLVPVGNTDSYVRKSPEAQSVRIGAHYNAEIPMGSWILFTGARTEWSYTWSDIVAPTKSNIQDLRLLFTVGVRF